MSAEEFSIVNIVHGCFVAKSGAKVVSKLQNVPRATISQNLSQFNAKVLLPLVLTHYQDKVSVFVLLYDLSHVVGDLEVLDRLYRLRWNSVNLISRNARIEETAVCHAKISSVQYYKVESHVKGMVKYNVLVNLNKARVVVV